MVSLKEAKKTRDDAIALYRAKANIASAPELGALSDAVKAANEGVSAAIADGALPCPNCDAPAVGIEHQAQTPGTGLEYEVGCGGTCKTFRHEDGTVRRPAGRGPMPKHAVDLWNAGPDWWVRGKAEKLPTEEVPIEPGDPSAQ